MALFLCGLSSYWTVHSNFNKYLKTKNPSISRCSLFLGPIGIDPTISQSRSSSGNFLAALLLWWHYY